MVAWRLTVAVLGALTLVQARDFDDVKPGSDIPKVPDSNGAEERDVCENFKCRKPPGSMCTVDYSKGNPRPKCICPTNCPRDMEPVCSVYGRTYDNMCRLHVEACRKKRRIEVAYQGECIAKQEPCTEYEKSQFPIRLMEWFFHLKEIDEFGQLSNITSGATLVMTDRERGKLAKWKYDQLDRKRDGKLGRRDMKDFRYALMPMEHCAEAFFRKCDTNKDKGVDMEEWNTCLGVYRDEEEKKMQMDMLVEPEALEAMVETNFKEMLDKLPDVGMPPASPPKKPDTDEPEADNWALVDKMLKGQADQPAELVEGSEDEEIPEDEEEEEEELEEEEEEEKLSPEEIKKMEKKRRRQERRRLRKLERERKEQEQMD